MLTRAVLCAFAACLLAPSARAATANASVSVSAQVVGTCTISGGAIAFGAYTPASAASQQGALTVNCTSGTAYQIALNEGLSGTGATRRMTGPNGETLDYDIYRDSGHSQRWAGGASAHAGTGTGTAQSVELYAGIAAATAASGSYSDTVTATLTY